MRLSFVASGICVAFLACGLEDGGVQSASSAPDASGPSDSGALGDTALDDGGASSEDGAVDADGGKPVVDGYKKTLTIASSKVSAPLTNFPVWIRLDDPDLAAHASSNGADIFFTDEAGLPLSYELQHWDASGHLEAWVKAPSLSSTADTKLELRYGEAGKAPPPSAAAVFSDHFVSVWHLEAPAGTSFPDALGAHDGTGVGLSATSTAAAQLGSGVAFDGGAAQITFTNALSGNTPSTISLWVSQGATTDNDALVVLGTAATDQSRWLHSVYNPSGKNPTNAALGFYGDDWANPGLDLRGAGWTSLVWVYDGVKTSTLYKNGVVVDGSYTATGAVNTQGTGGTIGNAPAGWGTSMGAHATIDEVRIANVARTAPWIAAEHANQSAPATFYTVGAEQLVTH